MPQANNLYTYKDVVQGIVDVISEPALDYIISNLEGVATISGTYTVVSGTDSWLTSSGTTVTGTTYSGTYTDTITSGSAADVAAWRLAHYKDAFIQAQFSMKQRAYFDSITTVSGRSDMSTWDNLLDDNTSTGVEYTLAGTTIYIELQKPTATTTNAVRTYMNNGNGNAYFAYSENGVDWSYLATTGGHSVPTTLTAYSSAATAQTNYIDLATGNNLMLLPTGTDAQYFRMYLTGTGYTTKVVTFDFSNTLIADDIKTGTLNTSLVQIGDSTGKMIISGSTIQIYDDADNLIVELGELS